MLNFKKEAQKHKVFDEEFYLKNNTDTNISKKNAFEHYCETGWKEFRNPSESFNTWWYFINNIENLEEYQSPIHHFIEKGYKTNTSTTLDNPPLSRAEKTKFNKKSIKLFEEISPNAITAKNIAISNELIKQDDLASTFYQKALELEPDNIEILTNHAKLYMRCKIWLRLKLTSERIIGLRTHNSEHLQMLALAYEKLEEYNKAIDTYTEAIKNSKDNPSKSYYNLAICQEKAGYKSEAKKSYEKSLELSNISKKELGIGRLHETNNHWIAAAKEYKNELEKNKENTELALKHALMLDHSYKLDQALNAYKNAKILNRKNYFIYYKIGCILEKKKQYKEASIYYKQACNLNKYDFSLLYRLGYSLYKNHQYKNASKTWINSYRKLLINGLPTPCSSIKSLESILKTNRQNPDTHFQLGKIFFENGDFQQAAKCFHEAAARRNNYSSLDYFYWGKSLFKLKEYKKAASVLKEIVTNKSVFDVPDAIKRNTNKIYVEYLESLEILENTILYESYHGASISCNPYAIFKHILNSKQNERFTHIWVLKKGVNPPKELISKKNVIFVEIYSDLYLRYLASSSYLINNTTFPPYFIRKEKQKYMNTWHGTPLKTLGRDEKNSFFNHANITRNLLQTTHLVSPNMHTSSCILTGYEVQDTYTGKTLITGHPRIDLTLKSSNKTKNSITRQLKIKTDRKTILYAPTWRGQLGSIEVNTEVIETTIKNLVTTGANVIFKGHYLIESAIKNLRIANCIIPNNIDTNELLSVVDILITDYSSIFFDFIPTRKPIIFYAYDIAEYKEQRGLYFDLKEMPGPICYNINDVMFHTEIAIKETTNKYLSNKHIHNFCRLEDGRSSERAWNFLLNKNEIQTHIKPRRKTLLFHLGPFVPNGITEAFINLIRMISNEELNICIALDPWSLESYPQRMQKYFTVRNILKKNISIFPRVSHPVATDEEMYANEYYQSQKGVVSDEITEILSNYYNREFRRLYGSTEFNHTIEYAGYSYFWTALFGLGRPSRSKGYLWLHNNMIEEIKLKYPNMQANFYIANRYDGLVSVSEDTNNLNKKGLSEIFNIQKEKFIWVENCINSERIKELSQAPISETIKKHANGYTLLGGIGRLSPEKGFDLLIQAFALIHKEYPKTKLIIAGQGPEKDNLNDLIKKLDLEDKAILVGFIDNPYSLFKELDLFVLSSRHEGLATVALESMVLECPIICSDIPGTPALIRKNKSLVFQPNVENIYQSIKKFLDGNLPIIDFNSSNFNSNSLEQFLTKILIS